MSKNKRKLGGLTISELTPDEYLTVVNKYIKSIKKTYMQNGYPEDEADRLAKSEFRYMLRAGIMDMRDERILHNRYGKRKNLKFSDDEVCYICENPDVVFMISNPRNIDEEKRVHGFTLCTICAARLDSMISFLDTDTASWQYFSPGALNNVNPMDVVNSVEEMLKKK